MKFNVRRSAFGVLRLVFCLSCFIASETAASASQARGGANSADFLRIGSGARGAGVGDALTAAANGVAGLHYNPAGLGRTDRKELGASYQNYVLGISYGDLGYVQPLGEKGAWGGEVKFLEYGTLDRSTIATAGVLVTGNSSGTFSAHDLAASLSYGRPAGNLLWGVTGRVVNSRVDNVTATAYAADLGLQYRCEKLPVDLGVVVKNIGTVLKFDAIGEDLPLLGRLGIAAHFWDRRIALHADVEKARNEEFEFLGGGEVTLMKILKLRAGYDGRNDTENGLALGLGFSHANLALDYAFIPFGGIGDNHRVGLTYGFGAARTSN